MSGWLVVQLVPPKDKWRSRLLVVGGFLPGKRSEFPAIIMILRIISNAAQPFTWKHGQALPTQNEWSWTNLSSILYVEQPIGTGFTQGKPTAMVRRFPNYLSISLTWCSISTRWQNEDDVAAQFVGFLQQFLEIFKELKGNKFYATGESVSKRF